MNKYKVTFYPDNKIAEVPEGTTILSAAISCGVYINSPCAGDGVCGKCKVMIIDEDGKGKISLACGSRIHQDLRVDIPLESRLELDPQIKNAAFASQEVEFRPINAIGPSFKPAPLSVKLYLDLQGLDDGDTLSDLDRLYRAISKASGISPVQANLFNIRQLSDLLRSCGWKITVTLAKKNNGFEITLVEPQDNSSNNFGLSFDIGTTTISGQLINLNKGDVLGSRIAYNRQAIFGADVITRIIYSGKEEGLEKLHNLVTGTVNQMIKELADGCGVSLNDLTCIVCSGNTTMIHLLLKINPAYIRIDPYLPVANSIPPLRASEAGITINPRGILYCLPGVASYVGGDITAGILSSQLYKKKDLSLLIDIGTNGEVALGNEEFIVASAASAGPAFEGSGLTCGMRASTGAIESVSIRPADFSLNYSVIGNVKASGICGSGYISLLSGMISNGIIDKSGKIAATKNKRFRVTDAGSEFIVAFGTETNTGEDIVITEADIENLKRAKAAVYSAVSVLIRHMNFKIEDIRNIFIAGGFGASLDIDSAIRIGLLPDLERKRFSFIGNSALAGARDALLSSQAYDEAEEIARKVTYFELSNDSAYMDEYMAALFFPHTDLTRFPSFKSQA
ncbi:MAG: Na(+)-translocating NADH-quinone reductase subunit F [Candidatus Omnitrophica bacterium ADurb.Bin205]|nr:MAG: Na(+)-translocating NADH-quinone reductase subunit F [Candidatus Omnitrophica bacterium ADurb.Bin205]